MKGKEFKLQDGGRLTYAYGETYGSFNISWGEITYSTTWQSQSMKDAEYHLVVSKNSKARLDSVCPLLKDVSNSYIIADYQTNKTSFLFKKALEGETYYVNVIAKVRTSPDEDHSFVPFTPIQIFMPAQSLLTTFSLCKIDILPPIDLYLGLASMFALAAYYYFRKS